MRRRRRDRPAARAPAHCRDEETEGAVYSRRQETGDRRSGRESPAARARANTARRVRLELGPPAARRRKARCEKSANRPSPRSLSPHTPPRALAVRAARCLARPSSSRRGSRRSRLGAPPRDAPPPPAAPCSRARPPRRSGARTRRCTARRRSTSSLTSDSSASFLPSSRSSPRASSPRRPRARPRPRPRPHPGSRASIARRSVDRWTRSVP